jgi:hypothetical protein
LTCMASMKVVSLSLFLMFRQMDGCSSKYFTTLKRLSHEMDLVFDDIYD